MKIRNIVLCLLAVALMSSCGGGKAVYTPEQQAIVEKLAEDKAEGFEFEFTSFEKIDSVTMGTEIDRRIEAYNQILAQNYRLYNSYVQNKKPKNAAKKQQSIEFDTRVLELLYNAKKENPEKLDDIAYYIYKFSGEGSDSEKEYKYVDIYAAVTIENHVVAVSSSLKNLSIATAGIIRGYNEILKNHAEDDNAEIDE